VVSDAGLRVLLVGVGRWGEKHARVLRELGAQLFVADVSAGRRAWVAAQGIPEARIAADWHAALHDVDAVDIVTPADSHREIAEAALAAGCHCFVEKPLAASLDDARHLERIAGEGRLVLQVGHIFRFHPVTGALRACLADGAIGRVRFITGRFSGFKRPRTDIGVTHTDGIHYFDLFAYLLGQPATRVTAVQRDFLGRGLDDMSITLVHYGDVVALVEANYFVPGTQRECIIVGETGSLVADFGAGTVLLHRGAHRRGSAGWEAVDEGKDEVFTHRQEPLRAELEAFLAACVSERPNPVPAAEARHAMEIVKAAERAAELGRSVAIDEVRAGDV
jgi:predicted dehydrogenase